MNLEEFLQQFNGRYEQWKSSIEPRFGCVVCLAPKLSIVFGLCQHRVCLDCAYDTNGSLKKAFYRCPTCQVENVFPSKKPSIPEDNITAQKLCGVRVCSYVGCQQEMWEWEKDEHELCCPHRISTPRCQTPNIRRKSSSSTPRHHRIVSKSTGSYQLRSRGIQPADNINSNYEKHKNTWFSPYPLRSRHQGNSLL